MSCLLRTLSKAPRHSLSRDSSHSFHTSLYLSQSSKPKLSTQAPSPYPRYPHNVHLSQQSRNEQEQFMRDMNDITPGQRTAVFPMYRKMELKVAHFAVGPTDTLALYVDKSMTKPEIRIWLEEVYNIRGIRKIHTSTQSQKKYVHRLKRRYMKRNAVKKVYVELDHQVDLVSPRDDDAPVFEQDVIDDLAAISGNDVQRSIALNWYNRRWLKDANPPSRGMKHHRSRHKVVREEMKRRIASQAAQQKIRELEEYMQRVKEDEAAKAEEASSTKQADNKQIEDSSTNNNNSNNEEVEVVESKEASSEEKKDNQKVEKVDVETVEDEKPRK